MVQWQHVVLEKVGIIIPNYSLLNGFFGSHQLLPIPSPLYCSLEGVEMAKWLFRLKKKQQQRNSIQEMSILKGDFNIFHILKTNWDY